MPYPQEYRTAAKQQYPQKPTRTIRKPATLSYFSYVFLFLIEHRPVINPLSRELPQTRIRTTAHEQRYKEGRDFKKFHGLLFS